MIDGLGLFVELLPQEKEAPYSIQRVQEQIRHEKESKKMHDAKKMLIVKEKAHE
jgi:hypothetical protein